jgi:Haemolysin secretion/activation protein ShlB/FhaC/HecB
MLALLPIAIAFQVQVGVSVGSDSAEKARIAAQRAEFDAQFEDGAPPRRPRTVHRIPVTDALRASAFKDPGAKELLLRARVARLKMDSALASYDATTYQRISVGIGFKAFGRDRLAMRAEEASRVQWERGRGALVDVTGARAVIPVAGMVRGDQNGRGGSSVNMTGMSPIPYYPGRDDLWIGGGLAQSEVDETQFVHPIAEGAEAYYTYQTGDSVLMSLPDGKKITLRELKITARYPKWNLSVGSFWFDEETAHLVRAVYRISVPMDVWTEVKDENEVQKKDKAAKDSANKANGVAADTSASTGRGGLGGRGRGRLDRNNNDDDPPAIVKALVSPLKVDISAITMEYGLYNQRFWLPRTQALEGEAQVSFMKVPVTVEQRFKYASVNALDAPLPIPPRTVSRVTALRDSLDSARTPRVLRDSLLRVAVRARGKEIAEQRARDCAATGTYNTIQRRYEGTVSVATRIPCDSTKLANSPDLPPSIYDKGDEVFGSGERDALIKALSFGLQSAWGPQVPTLAWGLSKTRYNRVEGVSTGVSLSSLLGDGYTATVDARGSLADRQLNGDFSLSRTNGRSTIEGTVYRRLDVMTDFGSPLSFGASLASLLYARDEGAYFRTWGTELSGTTPQWGTLEWRLFAEQEWKADVNSRWTLFGGGNDSRFIANPAAQQAREFGGALRLHSSVGLDPNGFRLLSDVRLEGAGGDFAYGRVLADETISHSIGSLLTGALTASAGYSAGTLPVQRLFYLGGLQTVRGQTALTASGDAFWLTRAELGTSNPASRVIGFADFGWAGNRTAWTTPGRPLSGVGVGWSFFDGLIRIDLARGLYPSQQWRLDSYLEAKF